MVAVAALALGACGAEAKQADDLVTTTTAAPDPGPAPGPEPVEVWAPAGAAPPVVLADPGDGATITIQVGDRVQIPTSEDFGGIEFLRGDERDEHLVAYGDERTFLAVESGTVAMARTVYDPERSCVPPQPVSEFTLEITDGPRPDIGEPVEVDAGDAGTTIELVPGQRVAFDPERILSPDDADEDALVLTRSGEACGRAPSRSTSRPSRRRPTTTG